MLFKKKNTDSSEKDELKKEYGIIKNSVFIMGKIKKYCPSLIVLMIIGAFSQASMSFIWSFIGKFVIDTIQTQAAMPEKDITPLLKLLLFTFILELFCMAVNTVVYNKTWWNFIGVRMLVIKERIAKALDMNYQTLEDPKMLDRMEKACRATGNDSEGVQGMMQNIGAMMVYVVSLITASVIISTLNPILIAIIVVLSFIQFLFFDHIRKEDKKVMWDKMTPYWRKINYMSNVTQDFDYAKDIRLYGMRDWLSKRQQEVNDIKHKSYVKSRNLWIYNSLFAHGISLIRNVILYGWLIYSVLKQGLSIGNFTLYMASMMTFSDNLNTLLNSLAGYRFNSMLVDDFRTFMEIPSEDDGKTFRDIPKNVPYEFKFENVSFKYKGQENYALKNLNLTLKPSEKLAVVGLNGAGKSTFIKLLLRLYDVTEGQILLNGINVNEFDRKAYYELFSPVFQNVEIFAFPIAENVSMKAPDNTNSEKSENCLVSAGMEEKLRSLENGVQTELLKVVYDDGVNLSGGEKQKLALARALYKNAPMVVLDEPTAALDALAEYKLYMNFNDMIGKNSAVYISHRLSSTRFCDNIAMFVGGKMVEYGTHTDLLAKNGAYAEMFEVQAQYYKENPNAEEVEVNV